MRRLTLRAFALLAGGMAADGRCQSVPQPMESALSEMATLRVYVECDIDCEVHGPRQTLFRRWSIGESTVRARKQVYAIDGERFRFRQRWRDPDLRPVPSEVQREVVFDGAELRYSSGDDVVVVHSVQSLREKYPGGHVLFSTDYFDAARIELPCSPQRLGSLPASKVLQSLYHGASLEGELRAGERLWRVEEHLSSGVRRTSWLSPKRGYAVVRSEERRSGALVRSVESSRFFRVGSVFLPGEVRIAVHGWPTVPEDVSDSPLLTWVIRVINYREQPTVADLRLGSRKPGSVIKDNRYGGYDSGLDGHILYHVPVPPGDLRRKFSEVWFGETPGRGVGLLRWCAIHVLAIVMWAVLVRLWPLAYAGRSGR